jgi:hypothetical protein
MTSSCRRNTASRFMPVPRRLIATISLICGKPLSAEFKSLDLGHTNEPTQLNIKLPSTVTVELSVLTRCETGPDFIDHNSESCQARVSFRAGNELVLNRFAHGRKT